MLKLEKVAAKLLVVGVALSLLSDKKRIIARRFDDRLVFKRRDQTACRFA